MNKNYTVRLLKDDEVDAAFELALRVFDETLTPLYGETGRNTFFNGTINDNLFKSLCRLGINKCWGCFDGERLIGMFAMRNKSHISMAFVETSYHKKNAGRLIFEALKNYVRENSPGPFITVNSSVYALPFYKNLGFIETDNEQVSNGLIYTPMIYNI